MGPDQRAALLQLAMELLCDQYDVCLPTLPTLPTRRSMEKFRSHGDISKPVNPGVISQRKRRAMRKASKKK